RVIAPKASLAGREYCCIRPLGLDTFSVAVRASQNYSERFACLALHAYGKGNGNTRPALRYFTKSVTLTVNHPRFLFFYVPLSLRGESLLE
ncbi:MAG: hypothetical protein U9Q82_05270, partial [Chloroflexota bacterium]|nr:hypothetical protein [Chloroflexota bacterium]